MTNNPSVAGQQSIYIDFSEGNFHIQLQRECCSPAS